MPTAAATESVSGALSVAPLESRTATVNEGFPAANGVPVRTPLPLRLRPAGKEPADTDH